MRNFQSKSEINLEVTNLDELRTEMIEQILENIAVFQMNGSGWTFHLIVSLDIHTAKHMPLRGGSWVLTPKFLADKKALINTKFRNVRPGVGKLFGRRVTFKKMLQPRAAHSHYKVGKFFQCVNNHIFIL